MKSKLLMFIATLVASACAVVVQAQNAVPYLPQKVDFGGTPVSDLAVFFPSAESYTLEADGTAGTEISIMGGGYSYTPEVTGKVRFSQRNGKVYVYEGNQYKTTLLSTLQVNFPAITDGDVVTNAAQLLKNCSFETIGELAGGSNYKFGEPWLTNVVVAASGGIRVGKNANAKNGEYAAIWRGSGNTNYFAQPVTGLKPNTYYKIQIKQVDGSNASATFNVGFGSTVNGMEYGMKSIVLGKDKNNTTENPTWNLIVKTSNTIGETAYFTFANTATNTSSAGSDPLTQIDYISVVEGTPITGIAGAANTVYLADAAYAPEMALASGDYYDMTSYYVINPNFSAGKTGWTENYVGKAGGDRKQSTLSGKVCWNSWSNDFTSMDINQALKGLPEGLYSVSCLGLTNGGNINDQHAYVISDGNTYKSPTLTSEDFVTWEKLTVGESDRIWVGADGELTIGFASTSGGGTKGWFCVTDYALSYYGYDTSVAAAELTKQIAAANELLTKKMSATAKTGLTNAITAAEEAIAAPTQEKIVAASALLLTATKAVNISVEVYTSLNDAITIANTNKENYTELPGYAAFEAAIGTAQGVYDTATKDSLGVAQAITALSKAEAICRFTADAPVNATFLMRNPDFAAFDGWKHANVPFQSTEYKIITANGKTCWNSWSSNFTSMDVYQELTDVPAGIYQVSCVTTTNGVPHDQHAYITTSNGTVVSPAATYQYSGNNFNNEAEWEGLTTTKAIVGEDGKMRIGFASTSGGGTSGWFCVTGFELTYLSALNAAPVAPALPEVPAATKPVVTGEYVIYHPVSKKFLSNNAAVNAPVLNNYAYLEGHDAYTFAVTVSGANNDTITVKQLSSSKFMNASAANGYAMLLGAEDATTSKWILKDVENGYNFASKRSPGKLIGMDGITGDNVGLYYDKGASNNPLFQFISKEDFFNDARLAYDAELAAYKNKTEIYNAKKSLMAAITESAKKVTDHPANYTQEATQAYSAGMALGRDLYANEAATLKEIQDTIVFINGTTNAYLMSVITASEEKPVDITFLITNPDFNANNANGWNGATGSVNETVYEMYQKTFNINQKLAGLPAGYYELKVQGFARTGANDSGKAYKEGTENIRSFLYGKSTTEEWNAKLISLYTEENTGSLNGYANSMKEADTAFKGGKYTNNKVENIFLQDNDTLTIGVKYEETPVGLSWTIFDNFALIYKGNTLGTLVKQVETLIAQAEAVEGIMQISVSEALANQVTAAKNLLAAEPTRDDLNEMVEALTNAIAATESSKAAYAELSKAIVVAGQSVVSAEADVIAAISTAEGVYNAKTENEAGIETAIGALKSAVNVAILAKAVNGDVTAMIVNPTIIQTATAVSVRPIGWENSTNSGTNGNFTKLAASTTTPEVDTYLEIWNGSASTIQFDYNQTIAYVPNGLYELGAATFTQDKSNNAVLYANEVTVPMKNDVTGDNFGQTAVNTKLLVKVTDGMLKIGIKTIGTLNGLWSGADYFKLTYLGDEAALTQELTDSVTVATGLKESAALFIVKAEMNKLTTAIDGGKAALTSTDLSKISGALTTLKVAITDARTSISLCTELAGLFTKATTLIATYKDTFDPTALQTVLDKNLNMYQNQTDQTDNAALVAAKAEMEAAIDAYSKIIADDIETVDADSVKVYVDGSSIVVEGADNYDIYTEGGIRIIANAELVPGIYIVKVAGQTIKIQVK